MNYSPELKDALLRRMLPPNNESITKISKFVFIGSGTYWVYLLFVFSSILHQKPI